MADVVVKNGLFFLVVFLGITQASADVCASGNICIDDQYCCGYDLCCGTYYYYSTWWFWMIWVFVLALISCCSYCLYRRRMANRNVRYVIVQEQPTYGAAGPQVYAPPTYPGQPASVTYDQERNAYAQKPPPYAPAAPGYTP